MKWKKIIFWTLAIVITLTASVYQRMTGPTHPKRASVEIGGEEYNIRFPRSGGETDKKIFIPDIEGVASAVVCWKKYPSNDAFTCLEMKKDEEGFTGWLPAQPPAGKLEYYVTIISENGKQQDLFRPEPLIIRFKGDVPAWVLIPHILLMFISMLYAVYAGLAAAANIPNYRRHLKIAMWTLLIGGFVMGPLLQHYAFGVYWSGFPLGGDLTDNKTLIAFLGILIAVLTGKRSWNRWAVVASVILMLIVFSIPHSMRGSELDHDTGKVITAHSISGQR